MQFYTLFSSPSNRQSREGAWSDLSPLLSNFWVLFYLWDRKEKGHREQVSFLVEMEMLFNTLSCATFRGMWLTVKPHVWHDGIQMLILS